MKIIEDIKNYTGRFILSRELSQKKVKRAFIPFADVQHIGIVYRADDKSEEEERRLRLRLRLRLREKIKDKRCMERRS